MEASGLFFLIYFLQVVYAILGISLLFLRDIQAFLCGYRQIFLFLAIMALTFLQRGRNFTNP